MSDLGQRGDVSWTFEMVKSKWLSPDAGLHTDVWRMGNSGTVMIYEHMIVFSTNMW